MKTELNRCDLLQTDLGSGARSNTSEVDQFASAAVVRLQMSTIATKRIQKELSELLRSDEVSSSYLCIVRSILLLILGRWVTMYPHFPRKTALFVQRPS